MNYRWSKNDRRMMQEVIDYFKRMLRVRSKKRFLELATRKCPFCSKVENCKDCSIFKCLKGKCHVVFPVWEIFGNAWLNTGYNIINHTYLELKALLRDAIKELEPRGEK